eukprot:scaffold21019_cov104-Skeletonema_dohrnii-CCMP3373.AAC.4
MEWADDCSEYAEETHIGNSISATPSGHSIELKSNDAALRDGETKREWRWHWHKRKAKGSLGLGSLSAVAQSGNTEGTAQRRPEMGTAKTNINPTRRPADVPSFIILCRHGSPAALALPIVVDNISSRLTVEACTLPQRLESLRFHRRA